MTEELLPAISMSTIAAAVLAIVARRVGQPLILGYIVAGALLGSHFGFGLVHDEAAIDLIAEIGLILLLFIIGLEINVRAIARAGAVIIGGGIAQVPLCVVLAWPLLGGLTASTGGPFDRLYLALGLSMSSTLIVVKLLSDKFEMATFGGRVTLGILIFQDLWAIVFLAVQPDLQSLTESFSPAPLLRSAAAGVGLAGAAVVMSRYVLPALFRSIARSPELMLVTSMAWCFLVAGTASYVSLSTSMGALVAGVVIAAFPYGSEVVARLSGVRDFFLTLFFVALGLKIPQPTLRLVLVAVGLSLFVIASRIVTLVPLLMLLRLDARTSGVVAVNLGQVSEFSLVILAFGMTLGHVSEGAGSLLLYTLLLTAVGSTYLIIFNHPLASGLAWLIERIGLRRWHAKDHEPAAAATHTHAQQIVLLGVAREGIAFLDHVDREAPTLKSHIAAVDFNPETLERLMARGFECHYGDISNPETLRHAGIEHASVLVSSISDWMLKGTSNARILRQLRTQVPSARIIVTADTVAGARQLYAEGADYVLMPPVFAAKHLYRLLHDGTPSALPEARRKHEHELGASAPADDRAAPSPSSAGS